ncbi:uncharacterized protein EV420DRAFT_835194 [Desarmillaria tabescens]|uniref:Uncharacterized protein n=1 Tax=Armillaria tabescens TaxID=1929756 RepID=A0AA39JW97_ARMTA|nr:uncharacterized protein EV420DRAFT_835194 [Desarmillaria tabescens]KAK0448946.1 hypothetical protein EV420DRAFT_835194 [Desarmillaria tabescens]
MTRVYPREKRKDQRHRVGRVTRTKKSASLLENSKSRDESSTIQKQLEAKLNSLGAEMQGLRCLLDVRTRELQDARMYLNTVDLVSGEDVVSMAEALNAEIFQAAAYMADSSVFGAKSRLTETKEIAPWIGVDFIEILRSEKDAETRVHAVQVALQASLARSCMATIAMWHPDSKIDEGLRQVYSKIQKTSLAPVAARWRVMTRSNSKYSTSEEVEKSYIPWMVRRAVLVLLLAGWDSDGTKTWDACVTTVMNKYGRRVRDIIKLMMGLDKAISESIVSKDIIVCIAASGDQYDPGSMENTDGPAEKVQPSDRVMCTSDLGLKVTATSGDGSAERDTYLLKPKVVLRSSLTQEH